MNKKIIVMVLASLIASNVSIDSNCSTMKDVPCVPTYVLEATQSSATTNVAISTPVSTTNCLSGSGSISDIVDLNCGSLYEDPQDRNFYCLPSCPHGQEGGMGNGGMCYPCDYVSGWDYTNPSGATLDKNLLSPTVGTCIKRTNGASCMNNTWCQSNTCLSGTCIAPIIPHTVPNGSPCVDNTNCALAGSACLNNVCTPCPRGKYATSTDQGCPNNCLAGTGANSGASSQATCGNCAAGAFSTAGSGCLLCNAGTYSSTTGASSCTPCAAGTGANSGATSQAGCGSCPAGTYSFAGGNCTPCPVNTCSSSLAPSSSNTKACTASDGTTFPCPSSPYNGTCSNSTGSTSCIFCPTNQGSSARAGSCTACAGGAKSSAGSGCCSGSTPQTQSQTAQGKPGTCVAGKNTQVGGSH